MAKNEHSPTSVLALLKRVTLQTRAVIILEAAWPLLFAIAMLAGFYVALSWLGVWFYFPIPVRLLAFAAFVVLGCYLFVKLIRTELPDEMRVVNRLEQNSALNHRPLTASLDQLANDAASGDTQNALWHAHKIRVFDQLKALKSGLPLPLTSQLDPYGLRTFIILGLFIGFHVAGDDRVARLGDILNFSTPTAPVIVRLDAWVTPPRYTGKPPVLLTNEAFDPAENGPVVVPEGSELTIRSVHSGETIVVYSENRNDTDEQSQIIISPKTDGSDAEASNNSAGQTKDDQAQLDYAMTLQESGTITVTTPSAELNWEFRVTPDEDPTISMVDTPQVQRSGALQIIAVLKDDYGVNRAEAEFTPVSKPQSSGSEAKEARALYEAPEFRLSLNRGRVKDGTSKTIRSIVDHPWAGAEVLLTLRAYDELQQEGSTTPHRMALPARRFSNPLARALIEQRRNLAMDANYAPILSDVIDVLTIRPERFEDDYATFISLAAIRRSVLNARDDDALRKVVDELWDLAIALEDGNLSDSERNLRDALQALRDGIDNGASDEELARLMEDARNALREFMQALAEQAQSQTAENQPHGDPSQNLRPQDLENMLDRIQQLAETGSREAAQQMLSELQQMMENLQAGRDQQNQQSPNQAQEMLNELGEMIRRQQQLRDQTFQQQNQGQQGQQSQQGQPGERNGQQQGQQGGQGNQQGQSGQSLQESQQSLAEQLQQFLDRIGQGGNQQGNQLGQAQRSMRGAAEQIGQGNLGDAGSEQSQALDQLRRGAQSLAEQTAGQGEGQSEHDLTRGDRQTDPLGRREGRAGSDFGDDVEVPDEIDIQNAHEIINQIRQRLGENLRPKIELDYLKRLLETQ